MIEIIISIIYISFLTKSIYTHVKKKTKNYLLCILVDIVFYTTLIFFNHRIEVSPVVENTFAITLLIILSIKLWFYKKTH